MSLTAPVWKNVRRVCKTDATLVVRFGGIHDRKCDPVAILKESFRLSQRQGLSVGTADCWTQGSSNYLTDRRPQRLVPTSGPACHAAMSDCRHATRRRPTLSAFGKSPAFISGRSS